ncbi:hypothetical protein CPC08DRAFT_708135 [Agrocybe pediades]|nr:hypothetical protein CPC08DRAFT_708135 [Agrocybe pediades]
MTFVSHFKYTVLAALFLLSAPALAVSSVGPGPCHPFPGAVATDCLQLISDNLGNDNGMNCTNGSVTLTRQLCSIITKCAVNQTTVEPEEMVRQALTTIGACALSDYGSISGYYIAENGAKTCYLYPGSETSC